MLIRSPYVRRGIAMTLALVLACTPALSLAAPVGTHGQIATKQAQQKAAAEQLAQMRSDLDSKAAAFISLGQQIDRSRQDISETETETAVLNTQLVQAQEALNERVVLLYKGGDTDLLDLLLSVQTADDFIVGMKYLMTASEHDTDMIQQVTKLREQAQWLQDTLQNQLNQLTVMQARADQQRVQLEQEIAQQQIRAVRLGTDLAKLMRERPVIPAGGATPVGQFNPDSVISETNFRASTSMSQQDIQAFLERQPGTLARYQTVDHNGRMQLPSAMIAEAAVAWGVSPKVILTTLQKEQSLLSKSSPSQRAYDWAMGCGKTDSRTLSQYQGLGKQIWFGAQTLRENADKWRPGVQLRIDGSAVNPANSGTYGQYRYTPHFPGVMSFWVLYWRYFGDPTA